ncbi:MAG: alpha-amylase [Bacteroidetes bacterium]|nr:alpha-amylase [Bacteroidota bacterium]
MVVLKYLKSLMLIFFLLALNFPLAGNNSGNQKKFMISPPFWYIDLGSDTLMLLINAEKIAGKEISFSSESIKIISDQKGMSQNYRMIKISVGTNAPDSFNILVNGKPEYVYHLFKRKSGRSPLVSSSDNMYLITPDRFANGDISNDEIRNYPDPVDRSKSMSRHGGDIRGIINHIPYLNELGVTALWLNPIWENNQKRASYHGYACTDFYAIDPRFGSLKEYQELSGKLAESDIALLMDVVYNHIGSDHPWMKDVPDSNWFHFFKTFTQSNYRAAALSDPNASEFDRNRLEDGWFVPTMPDLNTNDPLLSAYLIQNTLWWIETAHLSGLRIDTYAYPGNSFMRKLTQAVKKDFPDCFLLGEIWEIGDAAQAWFAPNNIKNSPDQGLDAVTDYQLYFSINKWLKEDESWSEGLGRLYYDLAADVLYQKPNELVTFVDNHDQQRFFGTIDSDTHKWKQAMTFLLTIRGIPCVYYGTELLFSEQGDDGIKRKDFPGGWSNDSSDKFTAINRTPAETAAFNYIATWFMFRKNHPDIFDGKLIHFAPEKGLYVYFRRGEKETLMVVLSNSYMDQVLDVSTLREILPANTTINEFPKGSKVPSSQNLIIPAKGIFIGTFQNR